ncbi:MAG: hypothetical protein V7695_02810 [Sulfitobacter sp.]
MSAFDVASAHWNEPPEWVITLARECDATSQNKVSKRLGYSASVISNVLRNQYPGNMAAVEDVVCGALMNAEIPCIGLGTVNRRNCREWRNRSNTSASHNSLRVTMRRACNRCPVNKKETQDEQ